MIKLVNKNVFLHHPRPVSKQRKQKKIKENRFGKSKCPLTAEYLCKVFVCNLYSNKQLLNVNVRKMS